MCVYIYIYISEYVSCLHQVTEQIFEETKTLASLISAEAFPTIDVDTIATTE